jgi:hypothetical protein
MSEKIKKIQTLPREIQGKIVSYAVAKELQKSKAAKCVEMIQRTHRAFRKYLQRGQIIHLNLNTWPQRRKTYLRVSLLEASSKIHQAPFEMTYHPLTFAECIELKRIIDDTFGSPFKFYGRMFESFKTVKASAFPCSLTVRLHTADCFEENRRKFYKIGETIKEITKNEFETLTP